MKSNAWLLEAAKPEEVKELKDQRIMSDKARRAKKK
jgi:hypothetical protein